MATSLNPETLPGILMGTSVGCVAEWLRSITVGISEANRGRGSGVIWRRDGLILTNAHVARGRTQRVEFADGRLLKLVWWRATQTLILPHCEWTCRIWAHRHCPSPQCGAHARCVPEKW